MKPVHIVHHCINHSGVASYALQIHTTGQYQNVYYCTLCKNSKPEHVQARMIYIGNVKSVKKSA